MRQPFLVAVDVSKVADSSIACIEKLLECNYKNTDYVVVRVLNSDMPSRLEVTMLPEVQD